MHEMSIVMGIVEMVEGEVAKVNARRVDVIELEIGSIAGIEMVAFDFAWPTAVKGTVLEHAKRLISRVDARALCLECHTQYELSGLHDGCPVCGAYAKEILQGRELKVKTLEVS